MRNINTIYIQTIIFLGIIFNPLGTFTTKDSTLISNKVRQIDDNIKIIEENQHSNNDSILLLAKKTLQLSIEDNYQRGICLSYYNIARIFDLRNAKDSAIHYYEIGLKEKPIDNNLKADYLYNLGEAYRFIGNYNFSIEKSLSLKEMAESGKTSKYKYEVYDLLAQGYKSIMEYDLSRRNYEKAAKLALQQGDEAFAGVTYGNMAHLFYTQNKFLEALKYFKKGSKIEEKYGLEYAGISYAFMADIYIKWDMLDSAEIYLKKAQESNVKHNDKVGEALTQYNYANFYFKKNDYKKADEYLEKAISYTSKTDLKILLKDCYKLLSEIKAKTGDYQEAYKSFTLFFKVYSNLYDVERITKVVGLEQRLIQQQKERKFIEIELKKQKTVNNLLLIIVGLTLLVGLIITLYMFQFKKLNKDLLKSKEKAEESDKLKSKFLQTISHEIRTPLNGIVGFSEMIRSKELSEKELKQVNDMINKNSDDLISTIENLVDIAHLSTNQYNVKKSAFKITPLLDHIIEKAKESPVSQLKPDLTLKLEKNDEIEIYSDKDILSKIILHLIKNALLYTEKGSVIVGYKQENSNLILFVKDTGIGIPQEKIDIIFSPFMQADENINIKVGGTGLGLTIVSKLIHILNGRIWVGSSPKKGSTFYISLPIS